jgi:hypothetical protein
MNSKVTKAVHFAIAGKVMTNVEIFSVGTWNDITITPQDNRDIVRNFGLLDQAERCPVKIDHNDDGPAVGWILALRCNSDCSKVLADIEIVDPQTETWIDRKQLQHVSVELLKNSTVNGKQYDGYVLDGLALLGATPPAVSNLKQLSKIAAARAMPPMSFESRATFRREFAAPDASKSEGDYGPHSDAGYADSGLQSDKKPRYPLKQDGELSEKRIRAAWGFINHPDNESAYSAADLAKIKAAIVKAWKAKIDKAGPPSAMSRDTDELVRLRAENRQLKADAKAEKARFAREAEAAAKAAKVEQAKAARAAVVELIEGAVRAGKILPAQRLSFTKSLRIDDDAAVLAIDLPAVEGALGFAAAEARKVMLSRSASVRDPREGAQIEGSDEQLNFSAMHADAVRTWGAKHGFADAFSAWAPYLAAHPGEQRAFTAHCFEAAS